MRVVMEQIGRLGRLDSGLELESEIFPLFHARVPLLVVSFRNGLMLDIQFPDRDYHALRNTNLVRYYAAVIASPNFLYFLKNHFRQMFDSVKFICGCGLYLRN